ncbi:MAG: PF20097 family protein [Candidatus Thorarchaeota archaeon]
MPDVDTTVCVMFVLTHSNWILWKFQIIITVRERMNAEGNHLTEEQEHKTCPSCGEMMEEGYLISKMGVYWDDHVPRFVAPGTLLSPNTTEVFKMHYVHSYRCRFCKIIQYGEPSDFVRFACPHCEAKYEYEIPKDTDQIVCQNCAKKFSRTNIH